VSRQTPGIVAWTFVVVSTVAGLTGAGLKAASESVVTRHSSRTTIGITILVTGGGRRASPRGFLRTRSAGSPRPGRDAELERRGGRVRSDLRPPRTAGRARSLGSSYESKVFVVFQTLPFSLLLFPDGRLLTRRWRIVAWTGTVGILIVTVGVVLSPGKLDGYPQLQNPAAVGSPIVTWLFLPGFALFCGALVGAVASVVVRFRRARGVERQQLTVLMGAGVAVTTTFVVSGFIGSFIAEDLGIAITLLGVLTIPGAIRRGDAPVPVSAPTASSRGR
jgi:hypothetical protein